MFAAVVMNLVGGPKTDKKPVVDYLLTGDWSQKAIDEAR